MFLLFLGLLGIWVLAVILGILVKTLAWLALVAAVLFVGTVIAGAVYAWKSG